MSFGQDKIEKFFLGQSPSYGQSSNWPFLDRKINCLFAAGRVDDRGTVSIVICRGPF